MSKKTRTPSDKLATCSICRKAKNKKRLLLVDYEMYACRHHHGVIGAAVKFLSKLLLETIDDEAHGAKNCLYLLMKLNDALTALPSKIKDMPEADLVIGEAKYHLFSHSSAYSAN